MRAPVRVIEATECGICLEALDKEIHVGDKVHARFKGEARTFPGTISQVHFDGPPTYDVDYDDGDKETNVKAEYVRDVVALPCGHQFHRSCCEDWISMKQRNAVCPYCREPLF